MNKSSDDDKQYTTVANESGGEGGSAESMQAQRPSPPGPVRGPLVKRRELLPPTDTKGSQPSDRITVTHRETGEVLEFEEVRPGVYEPAYTDTDAQETRRQRYEMKTAAETILGTGSRTYKCQRMRIDKTKDVEIKISSESGRAFFSNFQACGSVWLCTVCAPKVTERRKVEVAEAMKKAKAMGFKVMLLTGTAPHGRGDDVRVVLAAIKKGWKYTSCGRKAQAMREDIGLIGSIRVLETTYGENGWHPHFHALLILDTDMTPAQVEEAWWPLWHDGCVKAGLGEPSREHGIRVEDGSRAVHYVTKWGLEHELTKGHLKKGKKSCTPWDLLRVFAFGTDDRSITPELREVLMQLGIDQGRARALWAIYAEAFKGQRQLYWSNGLRKVLGLAEEKTDQELAEADPKEPARTVASITNKQRISMIRRYAWSNVLIIAESDPSALPDLWRELTGEDPDAEK